MTKQMVVYIAGRYRGVSYWDQEQNVREAEKLALEVWRRGMVALCPHLNTRFFQGALEDSVWLNGDLELVRRCDAVLLVNNWKQSEGAKHEARFAKALNIPVFENLADLIVYKREKLEGVLGHSSER